jgi:hypothetical protein
MKRLLLIAAVVAVLGANRSAQGTLITYFGEDLGPRSTPGPNSQAAETAFLAMLTGVATEDFEGFATGTAPPIVLTFGSDTATLTGGGYYAEIRDSTTHIPVFGRFPTSGIKYLNTNATFSVAFSSPQAAFGFYGTDIGDFSGQLSLTLTDGGTTNLTIPHTVSAPNASVLYFGLTVSSAAETFTAIQFGTTTGDDSFGFDDMTIGRLEQIIPEPSTLAIWSLLATLGITVGWWRRRRRAA